MVGSPQRTRPGKLCMRQPAVQNSRGLFLWTSAGSQGSPTVSPDLILLSCCSPSTPISLCHSITQCDVGECDWTRHAVQVVEQQVAGEEPVHSRLSEAQLSDGLIHPNVAITHKTISRTRTVRLTCKVAARRPGPITRTCIVGTRCMCW